MESSVSTVDALVRPWRTATIVAVTVAVIELAALVAVGTVFLGPSVLDWAQSRESARPAAAAATGKAAAVQKASPVSEARRPQATRPPLPRSETSVLVLNGNGVAGAAATEADAVRARGYVIAEVGNAPRPDYRRTIVMYRPGHRAEAARLSRDLGVGIVSPLDGLRRSKLMGAHVVVVIGAR